MGVYESIIRPAAFRMDAESAHNAALAFGRIVGSSAFGRALTRELFDHRDAGLSAIVGGVRYPTVIGLAAGYDKYGDWIDFLPQLGAGYEEFGTITPFAHDGNPRPRMFRLPRDVALINRMGLTGPGAVACAEMLDRDYEIPLNVSFDPNMFFVDDEKIVDARSRLWSIPYAKVLNVSCPNTEDGKAFESPERLDELLSRTDRMVGKIPRDVYVKFSHDLSDYAMRDLIGMCLAHRVTGIVISNTSKKLSLVTERADKIEGGLSGKPLFDENIEAIKYARRWAGDLAIIGVGGIGCNEGDPAKDVFDYLQAGASSVQLLTAIPYKGFGVFKEINRELPKYLKGYNSMSDYLKRRP